MHVFLSHHFRRRIAAVGGRLWSNRDRSGACCLGWVLTATLALAPPTRAGEGEPAAGPERKFVPAASTEKASTTTQTAPRIQLAAPAADGARLVADSASLV